MPRGMHPDRDKFLELLYPWDEAGSKLFKTVSWTWTPPGEKETRFANYSAQSFDDVLRLIDSRADRATANVYMALGTQRLARFDTVSYDGFPKAIRKINNTVSFNSIYLDVDVKPDAYANTDDAYAAIDDFIQTIGLPPATMEVLSGSGGVHVYWCTAQPIPVENWIPLSRALQSAALAYGLKFDPAVTVNVAGILRVPSTLNHKTKPPTIVTLMTDTGFPVYTYQQLVGALQGYIGSTPPMIAAGLPVPSANQPLRGGVAQNFIDNTPEGAPPVPIDALAINCPAIDDTLVRGGKGDPEPLWNQMLLVASFTSDPHDAAHRLSSGDPRYVHADTERKLIEKLNARANSPSIGWPKCATIGTMNTKCATCPLYAQGKSPFHFAPRPQPAPLPGAVPVAEHPWLPNGYRHDMTNWHVFTTSFDKDGNAAVVDVLGYPVLDGGIDPTSGNLVMQTRISGKERWGAIAVSANMQPIRAAEALAKGVQIYVSPPRHKDARDFLVAWMQKLQAIKRDIKPVSNGWGDDGGFTFSDTTYREDGAHSVYSASANDKGSVYKVNGNLQPWKDAMSLVYGNPALEIVTASSFAAPLIDMIANFSVVMSVYSRESGAGKSTALQLAQAVWGHPIIGMSALIDTQLSVMHKAQVLKHLPLYWDELRTRDHLEKVVELVFSITGGKGKGRLTRDSNAMPVGSFNTLFCVASNYGLDDIVYHHTGSTDAGGLRIFEIEAPAVGSRPANVKANQMMVEVGKNYGNAGAIYASFLAVNQKLIKQALHTYMEQVSASYDFNQKERFWAVLVTAIRMGALLANRAGLTRFDVPRIDAELERLINEQREARQDQAHNTLVGPDAAMDLIQKLVRSTRGRNLLITDQIHYSSRGKPTTVKLLDPPADKLSSMQDVWLQVGANDGRIRAVRQPFDDWVFKHGQIPKQIIELLRQHYVITKGRQQIGNGVRELVAMTKFGRALCYDFTPLNPIDPGSILDDEST